MRATSNTPDGPECRPRSAAVRLRRITKTFPGVRALEAVDLDLFPGEIHALLGENGAGKSTLVKILAGAILPDPGGEIAVGGAFVEIRTPQRAGALGISVIHQELNLVPALGAVENMMLGRERRGRLGQLLHEEMEREAARVLARLGVELDMRRPVEDLSVAERQLIEIGAALLERCRVLVLDEPTSALADHEVDKLGEVLYRLRADGVAILYISHRFEEIFRFGDRATVLRDGRVVGGGLIAEFDRDTMIRLMVGREMSEVYPRRVAGARGRALLEVEGLSSPAGLRNISFAVHEGEIVALAGLMGSGRTEVARAVFGADRRSSGRVAVCGRPLPEAAVGTAIRRGLALAPEDRKVQGLVLGMAVDENVTLAGLASLLGFAGIVRRGEERARVRRLIERLAIKAYSPRQEAKTLSGGNQQKVVLAKWLHAGARVFIFDEPTRGIDVGAKQEIYALMHELAEQGAGILMVSSELPEVLGMADRIIVMCQGRIAGELDRAEATPDTVMRLATGHLEADGGTGSESGTPPGPAGGLGS